MKKIGFLVQKDFLTQHFGVRNFFSTIYNVCAERYHVDYLVHECLKEGVFWHICDLTSFERERRDGTVRIDFDVRRDANFVDHRQFQSVERRAGESRVIPRTFYRDIGRDLSVENYDLLVITNPWLVDFDMPLPAKRVIGVVYDIIANQYALTKPSKNFLFSYQHNRGYQYYNAFCDGIYSDSEETASEYNRYYHTDKCRPFPPVPPYAFRGAVYGGEEKEDAMILAAPFDQRKGIEAMPALINGAADLIDTLYIYGMPRCPEKLFNDFFKGLEVSRIVYYPYIPDGELIDLYKRCKMLLFPSVEEGLGLPIIEAQVCGCRVVTTDKKPMNQLTVPGSCVLDAEDMEKNTGLIRQIMAAERADYAKVSSAAREKFTYEKLAGVIDGFLS